MARIGLDRVITGPYVLGLGEVQSSGKAFNARSLTNPTSSTDALRSSLRVGAQTFAAAVQNLNSTITYLNVTGGTLQELSDITDKLIDVTRRATLSSTSAQGRGALNLEFKKLAQKFTKTIDDATVGERQYTSVTDLSDIFQAVGLDQKTSDTIAEVFDRFVNPAKDDNLASDVGVKGKRAVIPPGAYAKTGTATSGVYVPERISNVAPTNGAIAQGYSNFLQDAATDTLSIAATGGATATLASASNPITLVAVNENTGYSVVKSTQDFVGDNSSGSEQLFLVDTTGSVVQQITNNSGTTPAVTRKSNVAATSGLISAVNNVYVDSAGSDTLHIDAEGGGSATLTVSNSAYTITVVGIDDASGYSVIASDDDFLGYNSTHKQQLFLVDTSGTVLQQYTTNTVSGVVYNPNGVSVSTDYKNVVAAQSSGIASAVGRVVVGTIGEDPALSTRAVLASGTNTQYSKAVLNDAGTYAAWVNNSTGAVILRDLVGATNDTFLAAQTTLNEIAFTDTATLVIKETNGGAFDIEKYTYGDGAFNNNLISAVAVGKLTAVEKGGHSNGAFALTSTTTNDVYVYNDAGTQQYTYDFTGGDTLTRLSIAYDAGNHIDVGVYGTVPSVVSDNDDELYRLEANGGAGGAITVTDLDISADNKNIILSGSYDGVDGVQLFAIGTIGDAASLVGVSTIAAGTSTQFTDVAISDNTTSSSSGYIAYVNSTTGAGVFKNLATGTNNAFLAGRTDVSKLGFLDNSTLAVVQDVGSGNYDVEKFAYTDVAFANTLVSSAKVGQFSTIQHGSGANGYFTYQDTSNGDLKLLKDDGTQITSYDIALSDTVSKLSLAYNGSNVDIGVYGVLKSILSYDTDSELYRFTASTGTSSLSLLKKSKEYDRVFATDRSIVRRTDAYQMLEDLKALKDVLKTNIAAVAHATTVVGDNLKLVRESGFAFLNESNAITNETDADKVAQKLVDAIRSNANGVLNQVENLNSLTVAALASLSASDTSSK